MSKTREAFTTPVGRLVQGSCFEAQTKDNQGNLRVYKSGDKIGQPNPQYFVAVAFPKADPHGEFAAFYAILDRVARTDWPALFPTPGGACVNPLFTFKVKDGDGMDRNGKPNSGKEGFAGHWIVSFASGYAPKVVQETSPGTWATLTDPASVKRGYFVRVNGSATGNDSPNTPGLYLNLDMIALAAYGAEIVSGPDAATAFGGAVVSLPPGASALPIGGSALPVVPSAALPVVPSAALPVVPSAAPTPVAGYTGYMGASPVPLSGPAPNAASPSLPPVPGLPSASLATPSPSRAMTALAAGQTYEAFLAAGWTDATLVANGYMTA